MVDEFSSFARMPAPTMRVEDASELLRQAVFLQSVGNPDIEYQGEIPPEGVPLVCDGRLVAQALTNVLKNASELVSTKFLAEEARTEARLSRAAARSRLRWRAMSTR